MDISGFNADNREAMVQNILNKKLDRLLEEYYNAEDSDLNEGFGVDDLLFAAIGAVAGGIMSAAIKSGVSNVTLKSIKKMSDPYYLKGLKNYKLGPEDGENITVQDVMRQLSKEATNEDQREAIKACKILKKSAVINGKKVVRVTDQEKFDNAAAELFRLYSFYCDGVNAKKTHKKDENILAESRLPADGSDPQYGIPTQKKYPLFDKKHVLSAIKLFGHVEPRFEEQLAKAIISKMRKYGIPFEMVGEENKLYKYLPEHGDTLTEGVIYEDVTLYENDLFRICTDTSNPLRYSDMNILESVLDPIQKKRCEEIFDKNDKMLPKVKDFILKTFNEWKDGLDKENQFTVDKIYLIGSSSGFQYTPSSDCDITIVSHDYSDEIWERVKATMPNGNNLPGTDHPVNYFIRTDMDERLAENMYNILTDKWEKKVDKVNIDIHAPYVTELARFFMNSFDLTLSEYERDKKDYIQYRELDPEKVEISSEERQRALDAKMVELRADLDALRMGNRVLRSFLHDAYDDGKDGFFEIHIEIKNDNDDPRYSMNNLVYKTLEKYGYRERIDKTIAEAEEFIEKETTK